MKRKEAMGLATIGWPGTFGQKRGNLNCHLFMLTTLLVSNETRALNALILFILLFVVGSLVAVSMRVSQGHHRYKYDPAFAHLVDTIIAMEEEGRFTRTEVRQAMVLAHDLILRKKRVAKESSRLS
jgi:hypothetical protein